MLDILVEIVFNLQFALSSAKILDISILLTHAQEKPFHLLVFLILSCKCLIIFTVQYFHFFVNFILPFLAAIGNSIPLLVFL